MQPEANFSKVCQIDWKMQLLPSSQRPPPIEPPSIIDMILHRRYVPRSRYYFCSGHDRLGSPRNVNDEQPPFILPPNNKLYGRNHYLKARKQPELEERRKSTRKITDNYHASRSSDILRRLHVGDGEEVEQTKGAESSAEAIAITDIDPRYFTELSGQVINERFSLRDLVNDTKEILRTKIVIEFKKDECSRIDKLIAEETKRLEQTQKDLELFKRSFDEFLAENREETTRVRNELEGEASKTKALEEKLTRLMEETEKIQREIYNLEKPWKQQKICQKFLHKVSPESWRTEHDPINRSEFHGRTVSDKFSDKAQGSRYSFFDFSSFIDLTSNDEFQGELTPSLYFKEPDDLIRTFNAIGMQKLNALTQQDLLSEIIEQLMKLVETTQKEIDIENQKIRQEIEALEIEISAATQKADSLDQYTNTVLHNVFNSLINSRSILTLQVHLAEAYNKCVKPTDEELSNLTMMKAIEQTYEFLNTQLDRFPKRIVLTCEKEYRRKKRSKLRKDAEAEQEAKRMERLEATLKRIMEPPKIPKRRLMWRSMPPALKWTKIRPPPPLTEEEILYLDLFTECNKYVLNAEHRHFVPYKLIQQMKEKMAKDTKKEQSIEEGLF